MNTNFVENTTTVCRTCLQQINNFSQCHSLKNQESNDNSITLRYKLSQCIPELDLDAISGTTICNDCFTAVNFMYDFKNKCLQTEKKIKTYLDGMFSSVAFVEFMLGEQVQQTSSEIVHSGLSNEKPQPVNIKIENSTDITEETSLHPQNMPNNELTCPQITQMQVVNSIKSEDYEREVTLYESTTQSNDITDVQIQERPIEVIDVDSLDNEHEIIYDPALQAVNNIKGEDYEREVILYESPTNDMTDVQIQERSVEIIEVDSSDNEHEIINNPKFERTNTVYTSRTPSDQSTSHMLNYTIADQNNPNQPNIKINHGHHRNNAQYQCNRCGGLFVSLRSHDNIMCNFIKGLNNPKIPKSLLKCSKCHFTCKYKPILVYHENLPHINGVAVDNNAPYKCDMCTKQFAFPMSLKQHQQHHKPNKLMKCNRCHYSTSVNKAYRQHKRSHHNLHKCPHCNLTMPKKSSLNAHIRSKHNNLNEFIPI